MKFRNPHDYKQNIRSVSDVLNFGKHKGKTVEWVIENEPGYILWMHDEKVVKISKEIVDMADEADRHTDHWYGEDIYDWMDEPF